MLFVCTKNTCRSQMAEGLTRAAFGGRIEAASAGARPAAMGCVDPRAIEAMAEVRGCVDPRACVPAPWVGGITWTCVYHIDWCGYLRAGAQVIARRARCEIK